MSCGPPVVIYPITDNLSLSLPLPRSAPYISHFWYMKWTLLFVHFSSHNGKPASKPVIKGDTSQSQLRIGEDTCDIVLPIQRHVKSGGTTSMRDGQMNTCREPRTLLETAPGQPGRGKSIAEVTSIESRVIRRLPLSCFVSSMVKL